MKNNRVIYFEIQADDPARAKAFYEKALGWKIEKSTMDVPMDYWSITTGEKGTPGIDGGLYNRPKDKKQNTTFDCTVLVKDIDEAIEAVKMNGGKVESIKEAGGKEKIEMPKIGWFARCTDPEGNIFGLMQATEWKP